MTLDACLVDNSKPLHIFYPFYHGSSRSTPHSRCLLLCISLCSAEQVVKEFNHPLHRSTFALPFLNFILISWLITKWTSADFSADLAKVFFWLGTAPLAVMTLFVVARQAVGCSVPYRSSARTIISLTRQKYNSRVP